MYADDERTLARSPERLSRRRMLKGTSAAIAAFGFGGTLGFPNLHDVQTIHTERDMEHTAKNGTRIVLVHGAFADGSGWQHVIPLLEAQGYEVTAVQNHLTSLTDDTATTKRVIDAESGKGPVIVVGHSYGGAVITAAAAGNAQVKALVYLAAFAPTIGEPVGAFLEQYPSLLGTGLVPDAAGFLYIDRAKFRDIFARDVDRIEARVMAATQKPIFGHIFAEAPGAAAWSAIPSWYLVSTEDNALSPDLQRFYAKRMGATTRDVEASHVAFISRPKEVVKMIDRAARATT